MFEAPHPCLRGWDGQNLQVVILSFSKTSDIRPRIKDRMSINDYLCEHVRSKNSRIVLAGDFNLPNIDWLNMCATHGEVSTSQALINLVFSHDLTQIVQQSTRTQGSVSSLLDLVFLSKRLSQSRYSCEVLDGISDHDMVLVTCPLRKREKVPPETVSFPDFSKADDESICDFF